MSNDTAVISHMNDHTKEYVVEDGTISPNKIANTINIWLEEDFASTCERDGDDLKLSIIYEDGIMGIQSVPVEFKTDVFIHEGWLGRIVNIVNNACRDLPIAPFGNKGEKDE